MQKKILILVNTLSFLISHRIDVIKAAQDNGYKVIIVYGELGNTKTSILSKYGVDSLQVPLKRRSINPFKEIWSLFSICKIFYKHKPDIVHLITIKAYLYGGIAARIMGVPGVISAIAGLGIFFNKNNWWNFLFQKIFFLIFYFAFNHPNQKVIVQNLEDKKTLIKFISLNSKKILLFRGSGVKLSKFTNLKEKNDVITICCASRLLYEKGIFDFVSAAKIIKKKNINAKFLLAGDLDPDNPTSLNDQDLQNIIEEKVVELLGYQKDIPALYARSHIICLPSFYGEGLPKALIEAAAAGRAVVTTDIPGCKDAIISNKTGLLVPAKNPQKLADTLEWLIKHHEERIAMGKAGRKFAEKEFPIEKIVQNHLNIYQELIIQDKPK
jgi:glycosyltransferase involved in cell wall biosynthesis